MAKNNQNQSAQISLRGEWLSNLSDRQVRALASQRKIVEWERASILTLLGRLIAFEDIMEPVRA